MTALLMGSGMYLLRGVLPLLLGVPTPDIPHDVAATAAPSMQALHTQLLRELPFANRQDFAFAERGFIATLDNPTVKDAAGKSVFDLSSYDFLKGDAPETVNPSLWRQAQLITRHGLYKVHERIYQVRGFDLSTVSFILTEHGYIVVDPLASVEAARAAFGLLKQHIGERPVVAVIYSHSHADHFAGVAGVTTAADVQAGHVQILAPDGFLEHAIAENLLAGPAMARRARFQFGSTLPRGPAGELTSGLGPGLSAGTMSLLAPTTVITHTGQEISIDGVTLTFQVTPGSEAPAEMNVYLPQFRAVFMAENANATLHNLLPARGALVRDAKAWADYLTESIRLYADTSEVMFAAHGIPRWGKEVITDFLKKHRDAYKYLHDQTLRLLNAGLTGPEIAEQLELPQALAQEWYNRGYYGTLSHNAKAVYQRYMGWYDANPASLHALPPVAAAQHYVEAMGGSAAVLAKAEAAMASGQYRWAAMLLNHLVFADASDQAVRHKLAEVYTQLAYRAEAGTWRNIYLTGAQELRHGVLRWPQQRLSLDLIRATPTRMLLDVVAVRLNPKRAQGKRLVLNLVLSDVNERHLITVDNSVLVHEEGLSDAQADATVTMPRMAMLETLLAGVPVRLKTTTGALQINGQAEAYYELVRLIDRVEANFNVVTP
ncbi:MAG: alkyl/aryl-sulfatase [Candidatus Tectimicrobiota bacterium]